jgi:hypothetical protein
MPAGVGCVSEFGSGGVTSGYSPQKPFGLKYRQEALHWRTDSTRKPELEGMSWRKILSQHDMRSTEAYPHGYGEG